MQSPPAATQLAARWLHRTHTGSCQLIGASSFSVCHPLTSARCAPASGTDEGALEGRADSRERSRSPFLETACTSRSRSTLPRKRTSSGMAGGIFILLSRVLKLDEERKMSGANTRTKSCMSEVPRISPTLRM